MAKQPITLGPDQSEGLAQAIAQSTDLEIVALEREGCTLDAACASSPHSSENTCLAPGEYRLLILRCLPHCSSRRRAVASVHVQKIAPPSGVTPTLRVNP